MEGQATADFVAVDAESGGYCTAESSSGNVALLVSGDQTSGTPVTTLQETIPATQFFIEQLAGGQARLQTADGQMIEIDVDPSVVGLMEGGSESGVPVLLRVAEDGTLLPDMSMVPTMQQVSEHGSQQQQHGSGSGMQEGAENGVAFPPGMYIEVHKESDDATSGGTAGASGEGTALAIVTPEGEESDTEDPSTQSDPSSAEVGVDRLEDFMDVVTTYRCKFCRFSCAWKSGLMSHFRSCHVASAKGPNGKAVPVLSARPLQQSRASSATPKRPSQTEQITPDLPPQSAPAETNVCVADKLGQVLQTIQEDLVDEPEAVSTATEEDAQERHIFICGQCSQGFSSLDDCKEHMVQAHELRADNDESSTATQTKKPPARKRGRPSNPSSKKRGKAAQQQETAASRLAAIQAGFKELEKDEDTDDAVPEEDGSSRHKDLKDMDDDFLVQPMRKKRAKREGANERLFKCSQKRGERSCGYRFRTEEKLEYHIRCHAPPPTSAIGDNRPFCCVECGERFDHWRGLAMHLWRLHEFDLDLHSCTHCPYKTFSLFKLDNHMRIHSAERDFTCAQCGKGFKQLSQLRNHHVVHLDRKNMTHKRWYSEQTCDLCQRTFSDSKCLRKHQQAVHNKVKPYVCTVCGHMSARKAMLQLHLRQHTGEKPFACNVCDYRTGDHNSLRRHKMRHSGTKPYKCPHCPYACIQAISYKTHMKNKHPGLEGLYACSLCNFRSVSKENFVNHMSDHKNGILAPTTTTADGQVAAEGSLQQQLEGLLPGNLSAAQLIYSCLSALQQQQEGGSAVTQLPPGVTSYSAGDGTHTITIQVPPSDLDPSLLPEQDQFFLTVQQQEDGALSYIGTVADGASATDSYVTEPDALTGSAGVSILKVNSAQER
ncbi:zinc finger protein 142-like [Ornithodoros turicata]|uniref:zinc finger protein 142-like n=1 Tax=Ornithodoros turicata TaxID=34597 RepID=UPI00313896C5